MLMSQTGPRGVVMTPVMLDDWPTLRLRATVRLWPAAGAKELFKFGNLHFCHRDIIGCTKRDTGQAFS
jgi:hypothetical protein